MNETEKFLQLIDGEWKKLLDILVRDAKDSFQKTKTIIDFSKGEIQIPHQDFGIYLFEIKRENHFASKKLMDIWDTDKKTIKYIPNISNSRFEESLKETKEWRPFYVGKTEDLKYRINQHCFPGKKDSTTYGLKLNYRNELIDKDFASFSVSYFRIMENKVDNIDKSAIQFVMTNLEYAIREEFKPWIGKQ